MYLQENAITKLATVADVDVNVTTKTTIFTVPTGKKAIITHLIFRDASISLTTASWGIGFDAGAIDVVADETYTELTGNTLLTIRQAKDGAKLGAAADILGLKCSIAQGAAATIDVDVFGYLIDA